MFSDICQFLQVPTIPASQSRRRFKSTTYGRWELPLISGFAQQSSLSPSNTKRNRSEQDPKPEEPPKKLQKIGPQPDESPSAETALQQCFQQWAMQATRPVGVGQHMPSSIEQQCNTTSSIAINSNLYGWKPSLWEVEKFTTLAC